MVENGNDISLIRILSYIETRFSIIIGFIIILTQTYKKVVKLSYLLWSGKT